MVQHLLTMELHSERRENCAFIAKLPVYSNEFANTVADKADFDFFIEDYGAPSEYNSSFLSCDLKVIVSSVKPWALGKLSRIYMSIMGQEDFIFLLNFSMPEERGDISELFSMNKTLFAQYEPDIFFGKENADTYQNIETILGGIQ